MILEQLCNISSAAANGEERIFHCIIWSYLFCRGQFEIVSSAENLLGFLQCVFNLARCKKGSSSSVLFRVRKRVNRNKVTTRSAHDEAIIVGVHEAEFQIIHDGGVV